MSVSASQGGRELYEFGPFRVDPEKETLLRAGEPVPLTPKTFQILLVLVRHSKEVVTNDDLMKTVWPDTFVEEANLSRNIFMLRKALECVFSANPDRVACLVVKKPCWDWAISWSRRAASL